ncbi:MAG: nicotinate-nucleotide adenylyltransferase, partial [Alphaproteobacteria bacterium]|nr:nicotinate-nucleotide adenylyltransferase [Alphaproteobacteria bacterium]
MQSLPEIRRIGLLGGSFNPAHDGHAHISRVALARLRLDELWWLVSPQNPLKPTDGIAGMDRRLARARDVAAGLDERIRVSDAERRLGTRHTIDTVRALQAEHPEARFVWIIGADNLVQLPRWKHWRTLFRAVPIAVFPRAPHSARALRSRAARRFAGARLPSRHAGRLALSHPPAWVFLHAA